MARKTPLVVLICNDCLTVSLEDPCLGILAVNSTLHNLILRAASNNDSISPVLVPYISRQTPPRDVQTVPALAN